MRKHILFWFVLFSFFTFGQSEWFQEPFIVLKDSSVVQVKRPVFIFLNEVICNDLHDDPMSLPLEKVQHLSKTCFTHRLRKGQIERLGNSNHGKRIADVALVSFGSFSLLAMGIEKGLPKQNYTLAAISFSLAIANELIIHQRKIRNQMIFETRGIKID
ncbi:MAG: hypothetical protein RLZZ531_747 [Bacteroidota bacterium]|jgi:hypothetical protein